MARTYLRQVEAAVRDWIINHEPRRTTGSNNAGGRQVHFALAPFHLRLPQAIQFICDDRGARFCRDQWHMLRLEDRPNTCAVAAIRSLMPQQEVFKALAGKVTLGRWNLPCLVSCPRHKLHTPL